MENLKVKFELNGLKFEMEGNEQIVRDELREFKIFTQQLLEKVNLSNFKSNAFEQKQPTIPNSHQSLLPEGETTDEYPLLKDIVMQDLPDTEFEWVLLYAFYESSFGSGTFTRESLLTKYRDSGRHTDNRIKKFSENFKTLFTKRYIKSKNDTEYFLLEDGKQKAIEILSREKKSTEKSKHFIKPTKPDSKEKSSSNKSTSDVKILKDLNLRPEGKKSLKDYSLDYEIETSEELYLLIVYYLKEILEEEKVTINHIFTGLIELGKKVPSHLKQTLINFRNSSSSNHWLDLNDLDNIAFSIRGMNHMRHDIKKVNTNE